MQFVPIEKIEPNEQQPRRRFDQDSLLALSDSIVELGVLQPILVRRAEVPGRFELVAGERRWRAAKLAGLDLVPVLIREIDDKLALEHAIVENLHRDDLNPMEEAAAYQRLVEDYDLSVDDVARRVGKSRPTIANAMRLFQLPGSVQRMLVEGALTAGHARSLLSLPDPDSRKLLARKAADEGLSVRMLERLVKLQVANTAASGQPRLPKRPVIHDRPALLEVENNLGDRLDTRVTATLPHRGPGKIVIEFADLDDLGRIVDRLE